ncbi:unnamed protein product [Rotaria magnacalcarata]|nr:unnamed protein product [Rotaria magnacalcarata]CAF4072792.1 unnamed protein product [Rotaria magnacalcarata]CAF4102005.1 unnamed protein product [Rotaria magnacalcarata]CAF4147243.1 unnamed protein product [Rotaria magnacalcarata]CAF4151424.1 unnamed protein product [Rotaria magnacalcarata]
MDRPPPARPPPRGNKPENGTGGKPYGGMTAELSDDDDEEEQVPVGRGGAGVSDDLYPDMNSRKKPVGNVNRRPPSASGQRRLRQQAQKRETYDDDNEDF